MHSRLLFVVVFGAAALGLAATASPAEAATQYSQLTVSESASTMTYGGTSPSFRASLTPPADDPPVTGVTPYYFTIGSTNFGGSLTSVSAPYSLFLSGISSTALQAGQYNVVANYQSPKHGLLTSAPVTFTVQTATPQLQCGVVGGGYNFPASSPLAIGVSGVTSGMFSVTFTGPETMTSAPQPLDGNGQFVVPAPSVTGNYAPTCTFAGSDIYGPATVPFGMRVLTISASHQVAGITLFTDPAPLKSFAPTTWEVMVAGQPGLPAPTGDVSLRVGNAFLRQFVPLGPDGTAIFTATSPAADPFGGIQIGYMGDTVYAPSNARFSIVTAPIPRASSAGAATGSSPAGSAQEGSTSPTGSAGTSVSPSPSGEGAGSLSGSNVMALSPRHQARPFVPYAIGLAVLVVMAAAAISGVAFWRIRRRSERP